ncbi:hypothetical protein Tco_0156191 [Tanacetum coccineum]
MPWLPPLLSDLRTTFESVYWEQMLILYRRRSVDEHYRLGRQINRVAAVVHNMVSARLSSLGSLKVTGGVSKGDSTKGSGERGTNADFGEGNRVEC